jgi:hypothetical protein
MKLVTPIRALAAAVLIGGAFTGSAALAAPNATIHFGGGSVAFIGSVSWGGGTLHFRGRSIPLRVNGIGVGAIGADKYSADGEVYHLRRASDIEGVYSAVNASATAGSGAGEIDMTNAKGVEIRAHSASSGLKLSLAPTGVEIHLK